jgi:hypothetical protein
MLGYSSKQHKCVFVYIDGKVSLICCFSIKRAQGHLNLFCCSQVQNTVLPLPPFPRLSQRIKPALICAQDEVQSAAKVTRYHHPRIMLLGVLNWLALLTSSCAPHTGWSRDRRGWSWAFIYESHTCFILK